MIPLFIAKDEIASGHVGRAKELEAEKEKIEKEILNHFDQLDQIKKKVISYESYDSDESYDSLKSDLCLYI